MNTLVRVIGVLSPGYWRVIVGPGVALLDGGSEQDWNEEWIPLSYRYPNSEFTITGFKNGIPQLSENAFKSSKDNANPSGTIVTEKPELNKETRRSIHD